MTIDGSETVSSVLSRLPLRAADWNRNMVETVAAARRRRHYFEGT